MKRGEELLKSQLQKDLERLNMWIKLTIVIRIGENNLSVHSKFVVPFKGIEICCSSVCENFVITGQSKCQLKRLALSHANLLTESAELASEDVAYYLFGKTPTETWNGFGIIKEVPFDSPCDRHFLPARYVRTSIGYNMPLNGDQLEFFMREFRKALV